MAPPKLEPGDPQAAYPLNEQGSETFNVGGVRRILPPEQQFEQLLSYLDATYPRPADQAGEAWDRYVALLPDRITHAAMMMLGTAVDHTMPGVAFAPGVEVTSIDAGTLFTPPEPTGRWAVAVYAGGERAREHHWHPEVAAAAQLSGSRIIDVEGSVADAVAYARAQGAASVAAWAFGSAAPQLAGVLADTSVYTFPTTSPPADRNVLVQVATEEEAVEIPAGARVQEYLSQRLISTPEVARQRITDLATFLRAARRP